MNIAGKTRFKEEKRTGNKRDEGWYGHGKKGKEKREGVQETISMEENLKLMGKRGENIQCELKYGMYEYITRT